MHFLLLFHCALLACSFQLALKRMDQRREPSKALSYLLPLTEAILLLPFAVVMKRNRRGLHRVEFLSSNKQSDPKLGAVWTRSKLSLRVLLFLSFFSASLSFGVADAEKNVLRLSCTALGVEPSHAQQLARSLASSSFAELELQAICLSQQHKSVRKMVLNKSNGSNFIKEA